MPGEMQLTRRGTLFARACRVERAAHCSGVHPKHNACDRCRAACDAPPAGQQAGQGQQLPLQCNSTGCQAEQDIQSPPSCKAHCTHIHQTIQVTLHYNHTQQLTQGQNSADGHTSNEWSSSKPLLRRLLACLLHSSVVVLHNLHCKRLSASLGSHVGWSQTATSDAHKRSWLALHPHLLAETFRQRLDSMLCG